MRSFICNMHFYITNDIVALYFQITEEQLNDIMIVECFWGHAYLFVFSLSAISISPWAILNYIIDNIDFYLFIYFYWLCRIDLINLDDGSCIFNDA